MTERKTERRGLGRGLSALMADFAPEAGSEQAPAAPDATVPVERLFPNPDQPRIDFSETALDELAASIRERGIIQPIIVRKQKDGAGYQIVAGERRWRAAQMAQLHDVPVIIRDYSDAEVLEVAIIENIQRADLNPVEEALGYRQLLERFGHTQEKLAEALGKSRSHVANQLRLLSLPEEVIRHLREGRLTAGHARALVTVPNAAEIARKVIAKGLTVRQTEELARKVQTGPAKGRSRREVPEKDADTRSLEADLSASLGMAVTIKHEPGGESGVISVRYNTLDDLDMLCQVLSVASRDFTP